MRVSGLLVGAVLFAGAIAGGAYLAGRGKQISPSQTVSAQPPALQRMTGRRRPPFTLTDLNGNPRQVKEWDGRVLALNFWATWCPPCRKEIPEFVALQKKYGDKGLQFVGIALQKPADVRGFIRQFHVNYPVLAGEMPVIRVARAYGDHVGALPYTVIIDRDGRIAFTKPGALSRGQAEQEIKKLL